MAQKAVGPTWKAYKQSKCYDRTPFDCPWCDIKFESKQRIDIHVVHAHKYNCNECLKEIKSWIGFLNHAQHCEISKRNIPYYVKSQSNMSN